MTSLPIEVLDYLENNDWEVSVMLDALYEAMHAKDPEFLAAHKYWSLHMTECDYTPNAWDEIVQLLFLNEVIV